MALVLYDHELSLESYKVRLAAGLMGLALERHAYQMLPPRGEALAALKAINPVGDIPVLLDGATLLRDPHAIITYLARVHAADKGWMPEEAVLAAEVTGWLGFAARDLLIADQARNTAMFGFGGHGGMQRLKARRMLRILDDHLVHRGFAGGKWFVGDRPTLADIALFPSAALSRDFDVEHDEFPALRRWLRALRKLPGFTVMPGVPDYY